MHYELYRCSLVKEVGFYKDYGCVKSTNEVCKLLKDLGVTNAPDEYFYMFCLDNKLKIIGIHEVSHGELAGAPVHPREAFKRALVNNAAAVIFAHNHPSGVSTPSNDDINATKRLEECGKILGIRVLDHIIVGDNEYYSFNEHDLVG